MATAETDWNKDTRVEFIGADAALKKFSPVWRLHVGSSLEGSSNGQVGGASDKLFSEHSEGTFTQQ